MFFLVKKKMRSWNVTDAASLCTKVCCNVVIHRAVLQYDISQYIVVVLVKI